VWLLSMWRHLSCEVFTTYSKYLLCDFSFHFSMIVLQFFPLWSCITNFKYWSELPYVASFHLHFFANVGGGVGVILQLLTLLQASLAPWYQMSSIFCHLAHFHCGFAFLFRKPQLSKINGRCNILNVLQTIISKANIVKCSTHISLQTMIFHVNGRCNTPILL
jgi:hypothetical protein